MGSLNNGINKAKSIKAPTREATTRSVILKKSSKRVKLRLKYYDYSQNGFYFITICQKDMACLFGLISNDSMKLNEAGRMLKKQWLQLTIRYPNIYLHEFVIMPTLKE